MLASLGRLPVGVLEHHFGTLGIALLDRTPNGVVPTAARST